MLAAILLEFAHRVPSSKPSPKCPLHAGINRVSAQNPSRAHPRQDFWVFLTFFPSIQTGSLVPHFSHSRRGRIGSSLPSFAPPVRTGAQQQTPVGYAGQPEWLSLGLWW